MDKPSAYKGTDPYIFVCYSHDDAGQVYPEISWLQSQGIHVWYDEGISPGAEWTEGLRATRKLSVLWSAAAEEGEVALRLARALRILCLHHNRYPHTPCQRRPATLRVPRHAVPACLLADVTGILVAVWIVRLLFG